MRMRWGAAFAGATATTALACSFLTDFSGLDSGDVGPNTKNDGGVGGDASGVEDAPADEDVRDGGGIAPDAGPYHPKYERVATVTNLAQVSLAASSTQCFVALPPDATLAVKVRPDLADVRIFGPNTERERVIDARGELGFFSFCFALERAIPPGKSEAYVVKYGDPDAALPPPAEANLFPFWEGFDGTALSPQRWLVNGAGVTVANGMVTLASEGENAITTTGQDGIPLETSLEIRARITDINSGGKLFDSGEQFYWWLGFQHKGDFAPSEPWSLFIGRAPGTVHAEHKTAAPAKCSPGCISADRTQRSTFRVYRIERHSTLTDFIDDDGISFVGEGTNGDDSVMIRNFLAKSDLVVDWARARPIVDPPPKLDLGPEEPAP